MNPNQRDLFSIIEDEYIKNYRYLRSILLKMCSDERLVEDIIQELFSKVLADPDMISKVYNLRAWMAKSAKNLLIDYYRKKTPKLLHDDLVFLNIISEESNYENRFINKSLIRDILKDFPHKDRSIFIYKEYFGYKYEEISDLTDIPENTLKSTIFRMKKKILTSKHWRDYVDE